MGTQDPDLNTDTDKPPDGPLRDDEVYALDAPNNGAPDEWGGPGMQPLSFGFDGKTQEPGVEVGVKPREGMCPNILVPLRLDLRMDKRKLISSGQSSFQYSRERVSRTQHS